MCGVWGQHYGDGAESIPPGIGVPLCYSFRFSFVVDFLLNWFLLLFTCTHTHTHWHTHERYNQRLIHACFRTQTKHSHKNTYTNTHFAFAYKRNPYMHAQQIERLCLFSSNKVCVCVKNFIHLFISIPSHVDLAHPQHQHDCLNYHFLIPYSFLSLHIFQVTLQSFSNSFPQLERQQSHCCRWTRACCDTADHHHPQGAIVGAISCWMWLLGGRGGQCDVCLFVCTHAWVCV